MDNWCYFGEAKESCQGEDPSEIPLNEMMQFPAGDLSCPMVVLTHSSECPSGNSLGTVGVYLYYHSG